MKRAFTLIELLVVITIISILAAILFPVFARAKAAAQTRVCAANMRQGGLGMGLYLVDHDDRYPVWLNRHPYPRSWVDSLQPYTKSREIWRCPSHTSAVPYDPAIATTTDWAKFMADRYCSYWLNAYISRFSNDLSPRFSGQAPISASAIPFVATTIVIVDGPGSPGTDTHPGSPTDYATNWGPDNSVLMQEAVAAETRHAGKMNTLLVDGHVKLFEHGQFKTTHTDEKTDDLEDMDPKLTHKNPSNDGVNPWWRP